MAFPTLNGAMMQQFVNDVARTYPGSLNLVVVDNASRHRAKTLMLSPNVVFMFQPLYSPEVNPCERIWQAIKARLA